MGEHHSNIVPWQLVCEQVGARLRVAPIDDSGTLQLDEFERLIGPRTRLVSVVHLSNSLGTINPVQQIVEMAHARGVPVLIDGSQAVYHMPVDVQARGFKGGHTQLDASKSSQFLTSLMLTGPHTREGLDIKMLGEFKTQYIDITMAVMRAFGAEVEHDNYRRFRIAGGQRYQARNYAIEPDASNASYFFAAAAVTGGRVRVDDITTDSAQGDIRFVDVLEEMGCTVNRGDKGIEVIGPERLKGIDVDMKEISDTSLTLAAIAPFADGPVRIRNIEHSRRQETDRVAAMATELRRLGVEVEEHRDGIAVTPSTPKPGAVDTYEDHRVAMSLRW